MNENGFEAGDVVRGSHELLESAPTTPRPNVTNENVFFRLSVGVGALDNPQKSTQMGLKRADMESAPTTPH